MYDGSRTMPELVEKTTKLYKYGFKYLFPVGFMMVFINEMFSLVTQNNISVEDGRFVVTHIPTIIATMILMIICSTFFNALMQIILAANVKKVKPPYIVAAKLATSLFLPALAATVLVYILLTAGFILMVIPAFLGSVALALYMPAVLFERLKPIQALKRSYQLVSLQPFATACLVLLRWVLLFIPAILVTMLINLPQNATNYGIDTMIIVFGNALLAPYIQGLIVCQYCAVREIEAEKLRDPEQFKKKQEIDE